MSVTMASSLPRSIALGFKDTSGQGQPVEIVDLPIFIPYAPLLTSWGPEDDAFLVNGSGFSTMYGADTFKVGSPLFTHQAAMVQAVLNVGGQALVRRLTAPGAKRANSRVWLDYVADDITQFERNPDGSFRRTAGALVPTGETLAGIKARFVVTAIEDGDEDNEDGIGLGKEITGGLVATDGTRSRQIPLFDLDARFIGGKGSNYGFRLVAPTMLSSVPVDADLVEGEGAALYRLYLLTRPDANTGGSVLSNLDGEQYVEFSLKKDVTNPKTQIKYGYDKKVLTSYESKDTNVKLVYGPLKSFHVYDENLEEALKAIYENEQSHATVEAVQTPEHTINFMTGVNVSGVPYYTYQLLGPADGGVLFGENASHWLKGGSDGVITKTTYDDLVAAELNVFGEGDVPYADRASYPMSSFIDSGFSLRTKELFGNIMRVRPDAWVLAVTQDANERLNTPAEDSSLGAVLRNVLQLVPESEFYGTGACRGIVMKHAGEYLGSLYEGILPFSVGFAAKLAVYMGTGRNMRSGFAPNIGQRRLVTDYINHNAKFRHVVPRNTDWQNGITSAEPWDHNRQVFFPGLQTVYHDNTSVLRSFFPMVICCHLTRLGDLAWRMFTGDDRSTAGEYTDQVDGFLEDEIKDRYDSRADITPKSFYTAADTRRGYSYQTEIEGLFDGEKTVQALTIIAGRRVAAETEQ